MAIKRFKGSIGANDYGWYAQDTDGILIIGRSWPREGGVLYEGKYLGEECTPHLQEIKNENVRLYNAIVEYYTTMIQQEEPIQQVTEMPATFLNWYEWNKAFIKFDNVIIRCMRENSEHESDLLFKCKLKWEDAVRLFGDYILVSIRQGYVVEGSRHEAMHTIQCTIYPFGMGDKSDV